MSVVYCGIDFHKRTCAVAMKDFNGKAIEKTMNIETGRLVSYLSNRKDLLIGIEASGGVNDMVEKLKLSGHDVRIINPTKFRAVGIGGKKTDERDAETIADFLRTNLIPEVHHKSKNSRELKSIIIMREHLVRCRTNTVNHVRGILREYGITMKVGFENFLAEVDVSIELIKNDIISKSLRVQLEMIRQLHKDQLEMEADLMRISDNSKEAQLLQTIPGIGLLGSIIMVAIVDDISRFKNAKAFASYLGLVPSEHSSGDKRRLGGITRSGSEITRRYLIHGARAVLTSPSAKMKADPNRKWAERIEARKGRNKATVALAHRLARTAFAVIRDKTEYTTKPIKKISEEIKLRKAS